MATTLWNCTLIDGTGSPPQASVGVTLEGDRVASITRAGGAAPEGAVDLSGRWLLPGLIDAHSHVSSDVKRSPGFGPPPPLAGELPRPRELGYFILAKTALATIAAGITSVRDVGAYDDE